MTETTYSLWHFFGFPTARGADLDSNPLALCVKDGECTTPQLVVNYSCKNYMYISLNLLVPIWAYCGEKFMLKLFRARRLVSGDLLNRALVKAAEGGRIKTVRWCIRQGATDIRSALARAETGRNRTSAVQYYIGQVNDGHAVAPATHDSSAVYLLMEPYIGKSDSLTHDRVDFDAVGEALKKAGDEQPGAVWLLCSNIAL